MSYSIVGSPAAEVKISPHEELPVSSFSCFSVSLILILAEETENSARRVDEKQKFLFSDGGGQVTPACHYKWRQRPTSPSARLRSGC